MKFNRFLAAAAIAAASIAHAQTGPGATLPSQGEVRKVDKGQGKVTLRHGPLTNLDMPAMTMVFTASDPKLLDGLKEGDKVRFAAEKTNGTIAVTAIRVIK